MTSPGPRTTPPTPALEVFTPGARPRALTSFILVPACCTEPRLGKTSVPLSIHHLLHHSRSRFGFSLVHETPSRAELHSARPTITVPWPTHVSFEAGPGRYTAVARSKDFVSFQLAVLGIPPRKQTYPRCLSPCLSPLTPCSIQLAVALGLLSLGDSGSGRASPGTVYHLHPGPRTPPPTPALGASVQ